MLNFSFIFKIKFNNFTNKIINKTMDKDFDFSKYDSKNFSSEETE